MTAWQDLGTALDRDDVLVASPIVAPLSDNYPVEVWSLRGPTLLSHFETVLDFGGHRVALATSQGRLVVVAAAYDRLGLAGYDALTGKRIWQRTQLKRAQRVAPGGDFVAASFDRGPTHVLDSLTGGTAATLRGGRAFWQDRYGALGVAHVGGGLALVDTTAWRELWRVQIGGFAVLDAAFSAESFVASDVVDLGVGEQPTARSSVYCVELSGQVVWQYRSPPSANCPALGWDEEAREWLGIERDVDGRTQDTLIRWSAAGAVSSRISLGRTLGSYRFMPSGRHLISYDRALIDARTGQVMQALAPRPTGTDADSG